MLLEILTRLVYILSLNTCSLELSTCKKFLGFLVDSVKQAYLLPDDKKRKFEELKEAIFSKIFKQNFFSSKNP